MLNENSLEDRYAKTFEQNLGCRPGIGVAI